MNPEIPKLRSGEVQGDIFAKQQEDLALVSEKSIDGERVQREKEAAEKAKAEAEEITRKQQGQLPIPEARITEVFDDHTITTGMAGERFYVTIQSPQARTRGRFSGICRGFTFESERATFIAGWKADREITIKIREDRKAKKRQAAASFVNPYRPGDILHSSWGYDQTNVEFFQVIQVRPRSLKIQQIAEELVTTGFMSGKTSPKPGHFIKAPQWVTIQISVCGGQINHHIPSPIHGYLYQTNGRESISCSWYA